MIDIQKQIIHWRRGAEEDWQVAQELIRNGRIRHGLFFAHLSLEKMLKANVCKATSELAPPIHNLVRLSEKAGLPLTEGQLDLLAEANEFNIEGRYPEMVLPPPSLAEAAVYLDRIDEVLQWLTSRL